VSGVLAALLAGAGFLWRRGHWRRALAEAATAGDHKALGAGLARTATALAATRRRLTAQVAALLDDFCRRAPILPLLERWRVAASGALSRLRMLAHRLVASTAGTVPGPRPTDLNASLKALERSLRRRVPRSVGFRFSLLPEPWLCDAEPDAVAMAIFDLVATAVADMPAGGDLIVGTRRYAIGDAEAGDFACAPGDYVRLSVKDNGAGLSPERLDQIFDPAATGRPAVAAAGELTRRLGGFARVESVEGIGTAVHLYFRRAGAAAGEGQQPPRGENEQVQAAAD
jgi:signal transduction histidine kinase